MTGLWYHGTRGVVTGINSEKRVESGTKSSEERVEPGTSINAISFDTFVYV